MAKELRRILCSWYFTTLRLFLTNLYDITDFTMSDQVRDIAKRNAKLLALLYFFDFKLIIRPNRFFSLFDIAKSKMPRAHRSTWWEKFYWSAPGKKWQTRTTHSLLVRMCSLDRCQTRRVQQRQKDSLQISNSDTFVEINCSFLVKKPSIRKVNAGGFCKSQ